jgi:RNA polymerase sigma factor (sigma-70 family)
MSALGGRDDYHGCRPGAYARSSPASLFSVGWVHGDPQTVGRYAPRTQPREHLAAHVGRSHDRAVSEPEQPSSERPTAAVIDALVSNHRQFLAFLQKRVGSRALAEDLLQEAFVRGMGKVGSLRSDESAVAWFYRLLRNAVIDQRRRAGASERKLAAFESELEVHGEPEPEVRSAICRCVAELAGTLKPEYGEALQRVDVEGVAVKDFAEQVGISASNAGVRVFRAREALRKQVARSCGTCAEHGCLDCTCQPSGGHCGQ